ncbi:transketolase C-terminal domain-containing protein [Planctomycetota bacterium]
MSRIALTGNDACAYALKQVNPDVASVFPITPQTELMHKFASYVANGDVDTNLVTVESEHSAMSACVGAAAAGARVITATSANGLALMWEIVYIAASYRLPIVMPVVNRALSGPINIHCDHSDAMGCRDSGWIQLFSENAQEAYDNIFQAFQIGENENVLLPVMVCLDGFILSHTMEVLETIEDQKAKDFVGEYHAKNPLLGLENPVTYGPLDLTDYYFEHKRQQIEGTNNAAQVIDEVGKAYGELSGRSYGRIEGYRTDDADRIIVILGSAAGTAKQAVNNLRDKGEKVGVLKIRNFRPFPAAEIKATLANAKAVAVLDRAVSFGLGGPVFHEVRSALYGCSVPLKSYIYGLGGRDTYVEEMEDVFARLAKMDTCDEEIGYIGLRE